MFCRFIGSNFIFPIAQAKNKNFFSKLMSNPWGSDSTFAFRYDQHLTVYCWCMTLSQYQLPPSLLYSISLAFLLVTYFNPCFFCCLPSAQRHWPYWKGLSCSHFRVLNYLLLLPRLLFLQLNSHLIYLPHLL